MEISLKEFYVPLSTQRPIFLSRGRSLGGDWRRHPGRPQARWI